MKRDYRVIVEKPSVKPNNPCFSSGPCSKRPGWSLDVLKDAALGRSHRSSLGKEKLQLLIDKTRQILKIPSSYKIGIVPGSDTGAFEMAMWSLLGQRGVDVFAWESFGNGWLSDIKKQLQVTDIRTFTADYGFLPPLHQADADRDIVFTWNGTTSGVKVPDGQWISDDRQGLVLCDATSAVFSMPLPWHKLDVVTWSWQKVMGGEGAHGVLVLSPQAVERLESYVPAWPLPKIFRLTKERKLIAGIFKGETINTPSMLCVEDALDFLGWAESGGGLDFLLKRTEDNFTFVKQWVASADWVEFLAESNETISSTSICLKIVDSWYQSLPLSEQVTKAKAIVKLLEDHEVAYDIGAYRDAPPGLRIWGGATIEGNDLYQLFPWLDWAFYHVKNASK